MPVSSIVLDSDRLVYPGSIDDRVRHASIDTGNPCLDLLIDCMNETGPTAHATSIWQNYDHATHVSDDDVIQCVAAMLRAHNNSVSGSLRDIDEKKFYYDRLKERQIGPHAIKSATRAAGKIKRDVFAR